MLFFLFSRREGMGIKAKNPRMPRQSRVLWKLIRLIASFPDADAPGGAPNRHLALAVQLGYVVFERGVHFHFRKELDHKRDGLSNFCEPQLNYGNGSVCDLTDYDFKFNDNLIDLPNLQRHRRYGEPEYP